eukprot:gene12594-16888_t
MTRFAIPQQETRSTGTWAAVTPPINATGIVRSLDIDDATQLYLYAWPLVMTSLSRKAQFYLPDNVMLPLLVFPNPNLTAIVRPNVDTLYDACWINHEKADQLELILPDTNDGLYYLFPLMDAWTNIVNSPGWRTTGKGAIKVLIVGPFSNKADIDNHAYDVVIYSPTSTTYLLVLKQSLNNNNNDNYEFTKSDPVEKIFSMKPREFFNKFANLMVLNPPILPQDQEIVTKMKQQFGLNAGEPGWKFEDLSEKLNLDLTNGMSKGIELLYSYPVQKINGWTLPEMKTGNFSSDYYLRAYIGLVLYAANLPQDAVYYISELFFNPIGQIYEILFTANNLPPTNQFWSITLYSESGYLVPNENRTYSISSQQKFIFNSDNSLRILISTIQPDSSYGAFNWLPAPQNEESFQLTLRNYWPKDSVLDGTWIPPLVTTIV